jgi:UPF0755 protein
LKTPKTAARVPEPRQPRRRSSAVSRVFMWLFFLFVFGFAVVGAISFYVYQEYTLPGPLAEKTVFLVDPGLGAPGIAAALEEGGIISDARVFSAMSHVTGTRTRLKAGEYEFAAGASMRDVMALIASGKAITYKLLVPEGWTSEMAVARVNDNEVLTGDAAVAPPEGSIMPDTYVFRRGMTRQKLVQDMQTAQTRLLDELWEARGPVLAIKSKEEAVVLASIVEKETGVAEERPLIASVFMNRLRKNMRLQSDPTIIYGIVGGKGKLDRPLTRSDIDTPTLYNTYKINGLPPGPIANPGRAALEAVLNPQDTEYLYFVADGSGGHAFSTTLEEHNRNVKAWRKRKDGTGSDDEPVIETPAAEVAPVDLNAPLADTVSPPPALVPPALEPEATPPSATPPAATPPEAQSIPEPDSATVTPPTAVTPKPAIPESSPPEPEKPAAEPQNSTQPPAPEATPPEPEKPAAAAEPDTPPEPPAAKPPPKPGSVISIDGKPVAVPKRKPKR